MPFSADRFERAQFAHRRQRVEVEALAAFFDEGEKPEWEVRGLSASEVARAADAARRQSDIGAIVKAIANSTDQVTALRKALGLTSDTPGEVARRLEMLVAGSVAPTIDLANAVKLAESFPVEFMALTNVITELTGKGADLVKPDAASQKTTA
jgi:hypothetical protein